MQCNDAKVNLTLCYKSSSSLIFPAFGEEKYNIFKCNFYVNFHIITVIYLYLKENIVANAPHKAWQCMLGTATDQISRARGRDIWKLKVTGEIVLEDPPILNTHLINIKKGKGLQLHSLSHPLDLFDLVL